MILHARVLKKKHTNPDSKKTVELGCCQDSQVVIYLQHPAKVGSRTLGCDQWTAGLRGSEEELPALSVTHCLSCLYPSPVPRGL